MTGAAVLRTLTGPRAFGVIAVAAGALLVALGLGMTFFADEWAFIESRSLGQPLDWLRPHNEHWSTLPIVLYRALVETVGIGSYVPYQVAVVLVHLAVAALVYRAIDRRVGQTAAFVGGVVVLLFGSGFENLYWGFQTGFTGSVALGLLALEVLDGPSSGRRAAVVVGLLLVNLMTSGTALLFCVAVGVEWLVDRRWRRWVPALAIPAATYLGWYLAFGRGGVATHRDPFTLEALADVPAFVARGFGNAARAITGLPEWVALAVVGGAVAIVTIRLALARRLPARVPGLLAAIATQYALIGLVRGGLLEDQVAYTRYTYVSGILLLVTIAALAASMPLPETGRGRRLALATGGTFAAVALVLNVALLAAGRGLYLDRADMTRALVTVGLARPLPPPTDPDRSLVLVPAPSALERIAADYGDPRTDALAPWSVRPIPADVLAEAQRRLEEGAPIPVPGG